jgi:ATP-dependent protease ClpP protease subunit
MEGFKTLEGEVGWEIKLEDIDGEKFLLNTYGGDLYTGWGIHDQITGIPNAEIGVMGVCASSGTIILISAENRWGTKNSKYSIHNPWTFAEGDAQSLMKTAEELKLEENKLIALYVNKLSINEAEIIALMKQDKLIDSDEALRIGLIKEVREDKLEPVVGENAKAMFFNLKRKTMSEKTLSKEDLKKELEGFGSKIMNKIKNILPKFKNILLKDTSGTELDFDVETQAEIVVGTKVMAPDGNYIMEDGTIYVIAGNEVAEIKEPEPDEMAKKDEEIENLKAQLAEANTTNAEKDTQIQNLTNSVEEIGKEVATFKNVFSKKISNVVKPSDAPVVEKKTGSRTATRKSN